MVESEVNQPLEAQLADRQSSFYRSFDQYMVGKTTPDQLKQPISELILLWQKNRYNLPLGSDIPYFTWYNYRNSELLFALMEQSLRTTKKPEVVKLAKEFLREVSPQEMSQISSELETKDPLSFLEELHPSPEVIREVKPLFDTALRMLKEKYESKNLRISLGELPKNVFGKQGENGIILNKELLTTTFFLLGSELTNSSPDYKVLNACLQFILKMVDTLGHEYEHIIQEETNPELSKQTELVNIRSTLSEAQKGAIAQKMGISLERLDAMLEALYLSSPGEEQARLAGIDVLNALKAMSAKQLGLNKLEAAFLDTIDQTITNLVENNTQIMISQDAQLARSLLARRNK